MMNDEFGELRSAVAMENQRLVRKWLRTFMREGVPMELRLAAFTYCMKALPPDVMFTATSQLVLWELPGGVVFTHQLRSGKYGFSRILSCLGDREDDLPCKDLVVSARTSLDEPGVPLIEVKQQDIDLVVEKMLLPYRKAVFNKCFCGSEDEKALAHTFFDEMGQWFKSPERGKPENPLTQCNMKLDFMGVAYLVGSSNPADVCVAVSLIDEHENKKGNQLSSSVSLVSKKMVIDLFSVIVNEHHKVVV